MGATGRTPCPASLPPSSGYTYAVELSADEAVAAGATTRRFSQPVPCYVENFVGFPVGSLVPTGFYDRKQGAVGRLGQRAGHQVLSITGVWRISTWTADGYDR